MNTQRLVRVSEAAEFCGLSVASFRSFAKKNDFKRIPGHYRYDLAELNRILDSINQAPVAKGGEVAYSYSVDVAKIGKRTNALKAGKRKHNQSQASEWPN